MYRSSPVSLIFLGIGTFLSHTVLCQRLHSVGSDASTRVTRQLLCRHPDPEWIDTAVESQSEQIGDVAHV
jgi:hypothetical protein